MQGQHCQWRCRWQPPVQKQRPVPSCSSGLLASHLPVNMLVVVQDGLARQSAVADDPVNHPVPDKSFMCLSHIAALPIQPSCVSLRSTSLAAARRGTLELVKCKLQKTGTRGEWPYLGETLVGCPAVGIQHERRQLPRQALLNHRARGMSGLSPACCWPRA